MSHPAFPPPTSANLPRRAVLKVLAAGAASIALPALAAWPHNPSQPVETWPDFGAQDGKARRLDCGSGGTASVGHIYDEVMKKAMGLNLVHTPYRGGAPITRGLIAGVIPGAIDVLPAFVPCFK